ncbi:MAG TPA: limonene-1,2-epoxide hydrolase family protein [Acidimicrobiales bacterium]|nr:limonene-1,2-epoxide hydrolase family protein [Acidimicrobiales bacterium]
MATPAQIVSEFIAAWPDKDVARLASFFSEDAVYHNIPMEPVKGREAIQATFAGFMGMADQIRFDTLQLVAEGPVVMTERVDHFIGPERTISLPVMGVFEVNDGAITAWRDYFDMNQFTSQMSGGG